MEFDDTQGDSAESLAYEAPQVIDRIDIDARLTPVS